MGKNLNRDSIDVEPKFLLQGIQDALGTGKLLLTDEQIKTVMTVTPSPGATKSRKQNETAAEPKNKKEGAALPGS